MIAFLRYSLMLIGAIMMLAPMTDPVVRFSIGPSIFLVGVFSPQIASLLEAALDDQAVSGTFVWTGHIPTDDEIGEPPAKKVSGDFGEQWQYQATEPVVQSIVHSLKQRGEITILGDALAEDHGWHVLLSLGGWKCDLLIQWVGSECVGSERERFAFRAHFPAHVYFWLFDQSRFCRQTQQLRSSLQKLLTNSKDIVDVDFAGDESPTLVRFGRITSTRMTKQRNPTA